MVHIFAIRLWANWVHTLIKRACDYYVWAHTQAGVDHLHQLVWPRWGNVCAHYGSPHQAIQTFVGKPQSSGGRCRKITLPNWYWHPHIGVLRMGARAKQQAFHGPHYQPTAGEISRGLQSLHVLSQHLSGVKKSAHNSLWRVHGNYSGTGKFKLRNSYVHHDICLHLPPSICVFHPSPAKTRRERWRWVWMF